MDKVFHLGLSTEQLKGAKLAIVPGDPERAERIANKLEKSICLAKTREFHVYLAELKQQPVVICSTGIGGPSTSIAVEELAQLGVVNIPRGFAPASITGTLVGTSQVPDSSTWTRTRDRVINSHLLYQLSYRGICVPRRESELRGSNP